MDAAFVLVWAPHRLSWVLARDGRELASVHGFPPGRPPLTADLARAWADSEIGQPQDWQADGSERFTTHPSTTREEPDMGAKKNDLSSKKNVEKGQKVYDQIVAGKCKDVPAALDATYGRKRNG